MDRQRDSRKWLASLLGEVAMHEGVHRTLVEGVESRISLSTSSSAASFSRFRSSGVVPVYSSSRSTPSVSMFLRVFTSS